MRRKEWKTHIWAMLCCILCLFALIPDIPAKATVSNGQIIDITADDAIATVDSWVGQQKYVSWNTAYAGECTAFIQAYMQYLGFSKSEINLMGADSYWDGRATPPAGITRIEGATPQKGDILIYKNTGHVAIYADENTTYHQNYNNKRYVVKCGNYLKDKWSTQQYWGVWRPNFTTDHIPVGYVDDVTTTANTVTVTGWAYDPDRSSQSLDIHVYIGESDQNRELGKVGTANLSSQDVDNQYGITGNHRFSITFETNRVGTQKIWVYPINIDKNGNVVERHAHIEDGKGVATVNITGKVSLVGISLNKTSVTLNKGATDNLTVSYNPTNTTDSKTVTWSSGNTSVAKVDQNGKITAVNKGTTTITAKVGSKTASCNVTVKVPLTGISLNKTTLTLNKGVTETLTVNYNPSDTTDSKTVTWSSGNTSVAKVDQNGKITAVDVGTTNILAKVGSKTASCSVTVKAPLTGISLNKTTLSLRKQSTETLVVSYDPINTTDDKTITWTSDNEEVATVSGGTVSALKEGTATITATVGSCTAQCVVTVEKENTEPVKKPLTAISLDKATMNLKQGSTDTLTVTYTPGDTTDDKTVTWTSDNEEVATVSGGTVSALKEGTATITATVGNCTAQCVVTVEKETTEPVKKPLTAISLDKATLNLKQGSTDTLSVTYAPGDTTDDKTVTWISDNEEVATVSGGTVSALKEGTATITATVGSCTAQCVVTVEKETTEPVKKPLTAISLDKATLNLKQGSMDTLSVTYAPEDTTDDKTVTWTSDNEEVATVSGGTVSALKEGTATITATVGSCTAQCVVTVVPKQEQPNLPSEPNNYSITEGANGTHKINEDGTYVLRASGELDKFVSIEVDGMLLDSSNYTLKRGSTIVTFTKEYMDQLAVGTHVIKVNFTDGVATTSINIQQITANKNDNKNTGEVTIVNNQAADSAKNQVANTETLTGTETEEIIVDNSVEVQSPKTGDDNRCMWIFAICLVFCFGFILKLKRVKK